MLFPFSVIAKEKVTFYPFFYQIFIFLTCLFYSLPSRASLIGQLVKNPPAMQETLARSLGWEDPLEEGKATHSIILAWRISGTV